MVCKPKDEDNLVCNESPLLLHLISLHNPNFLHVHLQIQPKAAWTKVCKPKDEDDFSVVKNSLLQHRAVGSRQDLGVRRIREVMLSKYCCMDRPLLVIFFSIPFFLYNILIYKHTMHRQISALPLASISLAIPLGQN
jgi:hypothetical protein